MSPAGEEEPRRDPPHLRAGPARPGGGTYPVRAAVSAPHEAPAAGERPPRQARYAPTYASRASPRTLIAMILLPLAVLTLVLLLLSLRGYLPGADATGPEAAEPVAAPSAAPVP